MTRAILRGAGEIRLLFLSSPERDAILLLRTNRKGCGMETVKSRAEQRVLLRNISWETYERLLDERGDSRVPRLAYDRGDLEIMSPSSEHESVAYFVAVLAEEMRVWRRLYDLQARRYRARFRARRQLLHQERGAHPWQAQDRPICGPTTRSGYRSGHHEPLSRQVPDLRALRRPRSLALRRERIVVYELRNTEYVEVANSLALPWFTSDILTRLVAQGLTMRRTSWARKVREWARGRSG